MPTLMGGRVAVSSMRRVEIEDLLGRDAVRIDCEHVQSMLTGKTVLVTGAGGSIGSELCRQLAKFCPALQATGGRTQFEIVRFGNVLGSTGSVIPKFQEQIARSRPVDGDFPGRLLPWLTQPGPVADEEVRVGLKRRVPEYDPARLEDRRGAHLPSAALFRSANAGSLRPCSALA